MKYQTFERFQGMWLGSIVGQALANEMNAAGRPRVADRRKGMLPKTSPVSLGRGTVHQNNSCDRSGMIEFPDQNWLAERRQIAEILLRAKGLGVDHIALQLTNPQRDNIATMADCLKKVNELTVSLQFSSGYNCNSRPAYDHHRTTEIKLPTDGSNMLSLLSLIIFCDDNYDLLNKIMGKHNLTLANSGENAEIREDILAWSYLLTSVLTNKFESRQINFNLVVEKILNNLEGKETILTQKLNLVVQAVKSGMSLHQLLDKMSSNGNTRQTAIALSWYCFATTPHDFKISVQRAASIKPDIAEFTAALTGNLSGAYNSIIGIPWNWRTSISQNPNYSSENQLVIKLFKTWLGIYSIDSNQESYNQELDAVASPQMIQPRQTLKIISQKSKFS